MVLTALFGEIENSINVPVLEFVAKSIKALNHEGHQGHEGKEKLFLVLFVSFVVPFFSEPFATSSFKVVAKVLRLQTSDLSLIP